LVRDAPVLALSSIVKDFRGLRPLRIERLLLNAGETIAAVGFDQTASEVLVNLMTGATLPDSGTVALFGRDTAAITDSAEWLTLIDRIGIVSSRAVLLEGLSVAQNLALPFSVEIEPLAAPLHDRAVEVGREVGLNDDDWDRPVSALESPSRFRVRLARALALDPDAVILEHPTAEVARGDAAAIGRETRAILKGRRVAGLAITADSNFTDAFASRTLQWNAATGRLEEIRRGWFARLRS
jgi:ABC-type transporter Mla maintaining outer membrane lipid asymmetry ATPase subunit MlaF